MTTTDHDGALRTALAYHRVWASGEVDRAMTYVATDVELRTPDGLLRGAEAFRDFMGPFATMARRIELLAAFGDEEEALLLYDTETPIVPSAPGAERHTVADGLIVRMHILFDRLPFERAGA